MNHAALISPLFSASVNVPVNAPSFLPAPARLSAVESNTLLMAVRFLSAVLVVPFRLPSAPFRSAAVALSAVVVLVMDVAISSSCGFSWLS